MKNIFYAAKVDGNIIEEHISEKRRKKLLEILPKMYPGREIKIVQRKTVKVKVNYKAIFTYEFDADDEDFDPETAVNLDLQDIGSGGNDLVHVEETWLDVEGIS